MEPQRVEGNRINYREESDPKTIIFILGAGDKATISDLELRFMLGAKKLSGSELGPCQ